MSIIKDLLDEFKKIYASKGLDALLPPLIFVLLNRWFDLNQSIVGALILAIFLGFLRLYKKESIFYAIGGLLGIIFASLLAYFSDNAVNFFLPKLVSSGFLLLLTMLSLLIKKPLSLLSSQLTRHWPLSWYKRDDVYPAYREVTWIWMVLFLSRFLIIGLLILQENLNQLALMNIILGTPFTIGVLIVSYLYGIWRLKTLKGPSVEEHLEKKLPPWHGQKKGF